MEGWLHSTAQESETDRMNDLFKSATLLKLRPPAASLTLSFAASFPFFRDSSKSIYINKTKSVLHFS